MLYNNSLLNTIGVILYIETNIESVIYLLKNTNAGFDHISTSIDKHSYYYI